MRNNNRSISYKDSCELISKIYIYNNCLYCTKSKNGINNSMQNCCHICLGNKWDNLQTIFKLTGFLRNCSDTKLHINNTLFKFANLSWIFPRMVSELLDSVQKFSNSLLSLQTGLFLFFLPVSLVAICQLNLRVV